MLRPIIRPLSILAIAVAATLTVHPVFAVGAAIMAADVRARWLDFIRLRNHPFSANRATHMQTTWCSRGVAESIWPEAAPYFAARGYRAWHIVPDDFPVVFFDLAFWRSVIGVRA